MTLRWVGQRKRLEVEACAEHSGNIRPEKIQVIFGRDFKLEAADPYLFYAFGFRRWSLDARVIAVIGCGFGDEHINKMLTQAIRSDPSKRLLVVANVREARVALVHGARIARRLNVGLDGVA